MSYVFGDPKLTEENENTFKASELQDQEEGVECTCASGVCNPRTSACVASASVPDEKIGQLVTGYVSEKGIELEGYRVVDSFYEDRPVKLAILDCGSTDQVICSILLTIDSEGKLLQEVVAR